jgi:hypothetical protein
MNEFDNAIREALVLDELRAPEAPLAWVGPSIASDQPRLPSRGWLIVAASLIAVAGLTAIVASSSGPDRRVVPGAATSTTDQSQAARARAEAELRKREAAAAAARAAALARDAAQRLMVNQVAAAVSQVGWSVAVPADLVSQSTQLSTGQELQYAEVRLRDSDVGELLVSIRIGDAAEVAAAAGSHGRLLQSVGTASVYLVSDGTDVRAVELLDGTTIINVRSESSTAKARSLTDLAKLALAFHRIRA